MLCPGTLDKVVPTGLDIPHGSSLRGHAKHKFTCAHCGQVHGARNLFFEEDGPSPLDRHWFALESIPEVAAHVAALLSMFAMIEFFLPWNFNGLTGASREHSGAVMGYFTYSSWTKTVLHDFGNGSDGWSPQSRATVDRVSGYLYRTTLEGGANGSGTVYEVKP